MNPVSFIINGKAAEASVRADMTVLEWLRANPQLRGTKEGCAEGDCGACSILIARPTENKYEYKAANSCIMLMGQVEGCSLITVEGLAVNHDQLHPVQARMAENGSSQCGFCTPGVVISLTGLLNSNSDPDEEQIHDALAGNLCRCTGYRPIVEAAKLAASESLDRLNDVTSAIPQKDDTGTGNVVGNERSVFIRPGSIEDLCTIKSEHPEAILLAGGTDLGLEIAQAKARWPLAIVTAAVPEMSTIEKKDDHIAFGGAVTWSEALPWLAETYPSFAALVRRFGSTQVRSMGTIAGNIGNASPIGDGPPALLALDAGLVLSSIDGQREIMLENFFTGYRATVMRPDEVITGIKLPLPSVGQEFRVYKISKRFDQDISTVCGAFSVVLENGIASDAHIAFGGMAATSQRCGGAEAALNGRKLNQETTLAAASAINNHFTPLDDWRGSAGYRAKVAANLVERFIRDIDGETVEVMAL